MAALFLRETDTAARPQRMLRNRQRPTPTPSEPRGGPAAPRAAGGRLAPWEL